MGNRRWGAHDSITTSGLLAQQRPQIWQLCKNTAGISCAFAVSTTAQPAYCTSRIITTDSSRS